MPKGRHLKPDFFTDKNIVGMGPLARLLYQGLWCYAADCGHLDDEPIELKMRILPADNCDVDALLDELAWHGRVIRKDGVLELPKLAEHQKPDKRYATMCDACKAAQHDVNTSSEPPPEPPSTTGSHGDHDVTTPSAHGDHAADGDGDGDGELMVKSAPKKKRATALPKTWKPSNEHLERAAGAGLVLGREVDKFRAHAEERSRTAVNWNAAFTRWLMTAEEYAERSRPAAKPRALPQAHELELPPDGLSPEEYAAWEREARARRQAR